MKIGVAITKLLHFKHPCKFIINGSKFVLVMRKDITIFCFSVLMRAPIWRLISVSASIFTAHLYFFAI